MRHVRKLITAASLFLIASSPALVHAWKADLIRALKNGGAYVVDQNGNVLFDHRSEEAFIPASTVKVATSALALKTLGPDYRFKTEFFIANSGELAVRGYGDPFLVSEEIAAIAQRLSELGLKRVSGIILDTTFFAPDIATEGASLTGDPYNALNGALIANFNTVNIRKSGSGLITSAEAQTPITQVARTRGRTLPAGNHRVNLGADAGIGALYTGELIMVFLQRFNIDAGGGIRIAPVPTGAKKIYEHRSTKNLADLIRECLKYSTNFIANQILLAVGAHIYGEPATAKKARDAIQGFATGELGWNTANLYDGAGLSKRNSVTARQMERLLEYFEPHKELLPLEKNLFLAKTGTLTGVNALIGFFHTQNHGWCRFAILVNSDVPNDYKFQLAKQIYDGIAGR